MKTLIFSVIFLFIISTAFAQKKDTSVYYVTNTGKIVSTKDSADYFLLVLPPDTSVDKNLNIVKEYYKDGKIKLIGNATKDIKFQGTVISFFPNGRKKEIKTYDTGLPIGDATQYYPNGKIYNITTYTAEKTLYVKCIDSTGIVMAENGNGKWIIFTDDTFSKTYESGEIHDGTKNGLWKGKANDTLYFVESYHSGVLFEKYFYTIGNEIFSKSDPLPEFPGGPNSFSSFMARNLQYPATAGEFKLQGQVILTFLVEKDGTLSNIKVAQGIGLGCDEEAIRVIKLSPKWKPGILNGKPVRVAFVLPIQFSTEQ